MSNIVELNAPVHKLFVSVARQMTSTLMYAGAGSSLNTCVSIDDLAKELKDHDSDKGTYTAFKQAIDIHNCISIMMTNMRPLLNDVPLRMVDHTPKVEFKLWDPVTQELSLHITFETSDNALLIAYVSTINCSGKVGLVNRELVDRLHDIPESEHQWFVRPNGRGVECVYDALDYVINKHIYYSGAAHDKYMKRTTSYGWEVDTLLFPKFRQYGNNAIQIFKQLVEIDD